MRECRVWVIQSKYSRNWLWDSIYWNQGYGYQQGYGPGYGGSDDSPHGYYGYGPGYYYSPQCQPLPPRIPKCRLGPERRGEDD
ncbi:Protein-Glutamine Gamma-Glutamyltransferase E [Manis pentadactyla]|nr:Protein-Glutamine Gamma-Glutamyltransferase E [Manis pentadactyla]